MSRNSGISFEREIAGSSSNDVLLIKVPVAYSPNRRFSGGGYVDFLGVVNGVPLAIEAKSCRGARFALSRITENQISFMQRWEAAGGRSVVLLKFNGSVVMIPLRFLLRWRGSGKRSLNERDLNGLPVVPKHARRLQLELIPRLLEELSNV